MEKKSKNKKETLTETTVEEQVLPDIEIVEEEKTTNPVIKEEEESLRDQFIRLQADFANFRNRTQRERTELYQRANEDLFLEILPVLDHYEMGLQTAEKHDTNQAVINGFRLVYDQFQKILSKFGIMPIDAVGEEFDPHRHEALTHMPSEKYTAGICLSQVRRGYLFRDRLLRAAQVVVSSGAISPAVEGAE